MSDKDEIMKWIHGGLVKKLADRKLPPIDAKGFLVRFLKCIQSESYTLNVKKGPIVFIIQSDGNGGNVDALNETEIRNFFDNGIYTMQNVFYTDCSGKIIEKNNPYDNVKLNNLEEVTDDSKSQKETHVHIFVNGIEVQFLHDSRIFHTIPNVFSLSKTGEIKGWLPIEEYRTLIKAHFAKEVSGEKGFNYWHSKNKWKLMAAPEGQFRKRLMNFLKDEMTNAIIDEECLNAGTNDRTDIRMVRTHPKSVYIIEVKWIGKSVTSNNDGQAAHDRANEGIDQLHTYVRTDSDCICGVLVVYDARNDKFKIVWDPDIDDWDIRIDKKPFLLPLDPTTASNKAKKNVKERKKRGKKMGNDK